MTTTRRDFMRLALVGGSALAIRWDVAPTDESGRLEPFTPNGWIEVDPSNRVTLTVGKSEMGQGIRTSLAMILAEEVGAEWSKIELRQASPGEQFRGLGTGGSWSVRGSWERLRTAGAAAREMLIAAAAVRWGVAAAECRTDDGMVIHQPSNRCLHFGELVADAAKLEVPQNPTLKPISSFKIVGRRTKRFDAPAIVTGRAIYGLDARIPGMHFATIARPRAIGGSIKSFDDREARKVNGVTHVVRVPSGVAVVARDSWSALKGRDALELQFDDGPQAKFNSAEHDARLEEGAGLEGIVLRRDGDIPITFSSPAKILSARYRYPFYAHAPLETMNCTAVVRDGKTCELWSPTQAPNDVQQRVATLLGIPQSAVTVNVTLLGGGFGRRLGWDFDLEAVEVARAVGEPVKVFWTRSDDMHHGYFQAASLHDMSAAIDADGAIRGWKHKKVSTPNNARGVATAEQLRDPAYLRSSAAWGVFDLPYGVPAVEATYVPLSTHVPIGPWRAVFAPSSIFARECFLDEIAHSLKKDPFQLRDELLAGDDSSAGSSSIRSASRRRSRVV